MNYLRLYWQEMLEAVFVVHSEDERIVHGDIKPQNFVFVKGNNHFEFLNLTCYFAHSHRSYQID